MKKNSRVLFFRCIHPLNLPLALLASFILRIIYWKTERVSTRWLNRFEVLDPADYFSREEYTTLLNKNYDSWQASASDWKQKIFPEYKISNLKINFNNNLLQWMVMDYEEQSVFSNLIERWIQREQNKKGCYLAGSFSTRWIHCLGINPLTPSGIRTVSFFSCLDLFWQWALCIMHLSWQIFLLVCTRDSINSKRKSYKILWTGISPIEMAAGPGKIDFSFLVKRGLISSADCLYILPQKPREEVLTWLAKNNINWETTSSLYSCLTFEKRALISISLITSIIKGFFCKKDRNFAPILLQFSLRAQAHIAVAQTLHFDVYLTTVSGCWPESPIVAAMNALGIRTVNWSYGSNTFSFSSKNSLFKDVNLIRSVTVAQEVWFWNDTVSDWFNARPILPENSRPVIQLIGSVMCGDSSLLKKTPSEARQFYGLSEKDGSRFIAIFDIPPINKDKRLKNGEGPTPYPIEMLEQFFEDLSRVIEKLPEINLIIKPKRSLHDSQRDYATGMYRLMDLEGIYRKQKRVFILGHDIDPYIPVAMADLCLGLPFTSPVVVGLSSGRGGIYHDPLSSILYFRPKIMEPIMTHGQKELLARLKIWLQNNQTTVYKENDLLSKGSSYLGPHGDPAVRFAELLKEQKL